MTADSPAPIDWQRFTSDRAFWLLFATRNEPVRESGMTGIELADYFDSLVEARRNDGRAA